MSLFLTRVGSGAEAVLAGGGGGAAAVLLGLLAADQLRLARTGTLIPTQLAVRLVLKKVRKEREIRGLQ